VKFKIAVCLLLAAAALSACRKSPAPASAATGTTGQAASSVTPPAGGPPPATPAAPAKPVPAQLPDLIARVKNCLPIGADYFMEDSDLEIAISRVEDSSRLLGFVTVGIRKK